MTHSFISNPFQPVNGKTILLVLHEFFRLIYLNSFFFLPFFFLWEGGGGGGGLQTLDSSKKKGQVYPTHWAGLPQFPRPELLGAMLPHPEYWELKNTINLRLN